MLQVEKKLRYKTKELKETPELINEEVTVKGWLRTIRAQKTFAFLEVNDGSQISNIQVILEDLDKYQDIMPDLQTGASVSVTGILTESPGGKQTVEIKATSLTLIGKAPSDYVLQKKRHSFEFLRTLCHLRPRTNTLGAVSRVRNALAFATHEFFQGRGFNYIHTPIITTSDCEGAGELFKVTTKDGEDFFDKEAYLTVSGQLNGECYALAMSDIYTFGPTFRAENSNTSRHLAEFWMIEPEMAFADLNDDMNLAEDYLKFLIKKILATCSEDMDFFDKFIKKGLIEELSHVLETKSVRISYTEAISILGKSNQKFEFPHTWGVDLQSEHERFLSETHFKAPVIVYDYPAAIKPFYMKLNPDEKTVAAMDLLVPKTGELIGGSQREDSLELLEANMRKANLDMESYKWYTDLRKYGGCPHAGFGLGFERLVQYITGMDNIRDVIPFPRYPRHAQW